MSDDQAPPPSEEEEVDAEVVEGRKLLTGEFLRSLVTISSPLYNLRGGIALSEDDAFAALLNRLDPMLKGKLDHLDRAGTRLENLLPDAGVNDNDFADSIAYSIVTALPEEMRTAEVLNSMDLRPWLDAMKSQSDAAVKVKESMSQDDHFVWKPEAYDAAIQAITEFETGEISNLQQGTELSDEQRAKLQAEITQWKPGVVGLNVSGRAMVEGETVALQAVGQVPFNPQSLEAPIDGDIGFPVEDLRALVQGGMMTLDQLVEQEGLIADELGGGMFPVDTGIGVSAQPKTKVLSALDALNYLTKLPEDEVRKMQQKLVASGYYDRVGEIAIEYGDPYDPATMKAWQAMLTDSVRMNKPVTKLIADEARTYRTKIREQRLGTLQDIDTEYVDVVANDFARSYMGRGLTKMELDGVKQYLDGLRTERAGFIAGQGGEYLPNEFGYTEGDIEQHVRTSQSQDKLLDVSGQHIFRVAKLLGGE
jgi:hypothetical protein